LQSNAFPREYNPNGLFYEEAVGVFSFGLDSTDAGISMNRFSGGYDRDAILLVHTIYREREGESERPVNMYWNNNDYDDDGDNNDPI
jgi:hypothetical protein